MSSIKRTSGDSYKALGDLQVFAEEWALKNADKIKRNCASCTYAVRSGPFKCCVYNAVPPIDVIMNGCESYCDSDYIPF